MVWPDQPASSSYLGMVREVGSDQHSTSALAGRLGMVREAFPTATGDGWLFRVGFLASSKSWHKWGRFAVFPERALEATGFVNPTQRRLHWTREHTLGRLPRERGKPWRDLIALALVTEIVWQAGVEEARDAAWRTAAPIRAEASAALARLLELDRNEALRWVYEYEDFRWVSTPEDRGVPLQLACHVVPEEDALEARDLLVAATPRGWDSGADEGPPFFPVYRLHSEAVRCLVWTKPRDGSSVFLAPGITAARMTCRCFASPARWHTANRLP